MDLVQWSGGGLEPGKSEVSKRRQRFNDWTLKTK